MSTSLLRGMQMSVSSMQSQPLADINKDINETSFWEKYNYFQYKINLFQSPYNKDTLWNDIQPLLQH